MAGLAAGRAKNLPGRAEQEHARGDQVEVGHGPQPGCALAYLAPSAANPVEQVQVHTRFVLTPSAPQPGSGQVVPEPMHVALAHVAPVLIYATIGALLGSRLFGVRASSDR